MRHKFTKIVTSVLLASMVITMLPKSIASAAKKEAYTVSTSFSYKNPETGKTADGSTNIALGESMIKSMLEATALVEEVDGKKYVTIGLGLMSNVSNVRVMTQSTSGSYSQASLTKTGSTSKNGDTVNHYRFEVSDTSKYISPILYIDPMGRDVQFYMSLKMNTKKSGTGEYKALLAGSSETPKKTSAPKVTEKPVKTEAPAATVKPTEAPAATKTPTMTKTPDATATPEISQQEAEDKSNIVSAENTSVQAETVETALPQEAETPDHTRTICFSIIGISVAGMALAGAGYLLMERKRRGKDHE